MEDAKAKAIELAVQTVLGSGLLVTLVRYLTDLSRERDLRVRESKKPFHQRQLDLYFEVCDVASKLATMDDSEEREKCRQRFWQLYWGQLCIVESEDVSDAMTAFAEKLGSGSRRALQDKAFALAMCCRESVANTWDEKLRPFTRDHESSGDITGTRHRAA